MDNNTNNEPNQNVYNNNSNVNQAPEVQPPLATPADPGNTNTVSSSPTPKKSKNLLHLLAVPLLIILIAAVAYAAYSYGKDKSKPATTSVNTMSSMTTTANITVPNGATLLEQCVPGLGAQYVMPKNIPEGPIYNVYNGKVVGIEYMDDLSMLSSPSAMSTLNLMGAKYDHVNISPMPGHAGLQANHYQLDFMFISKSQASMIKCASSTPASNSNMSM